MAAPPGYEQNGYDENGNETYRPIMPTPPVAANVNDDGYGDSIPKAWQGQRDNGQVSVADLDALLGDGLIQRTTVTPVRWLYKITTKGLDYLRGPVTAP